MYLRDLPVQFLVRLILDDRPGALAHAAGAIADIGGNIVSMDVVEHGDKTVVDDFIVQLTDETTDRIVEHLSSMPGIEVECVRTTPVTELHQELELISTLATVTQPSLDLFARLIPAIVRCDWAVVVSSVNAAPTITYASVRGPRMRWTSLPWLPLAKAELLDASEDWVPTSLQSKSLSLVAAPVNLETSVLACREDGPRFRSREIDRVAQLAHLAGRLLQSGMST